MTQNPKYQVLGCTVLKKAGKVEDKMKRQQVHKKWKSGGHRKKYPLTLLLVCSLWSGFKKQENMKWYSQVNKGKIL